MGQVHNELRRARGILTGIKTAVGMTDGDSGVERLSESLTPVADIWSLPEWAILRGERLYARLCSPAGVALRTSGVELVNPAGSGILCVVETCIIRAAANVNVQVDSGGAIGANPVVLRGVSRDSRLAQLGEVSICTLTEGDFAAGANLPQWELTNLVAIKVAYIIHPGRKLFFLADQANQAFFLSIEFRERAAFPGELLANG